MRIVLDLQGAQSESRVRGIGRFSLSFAQAFVRQAARHEIVIALNARLAGTIEPVRAAFDGLLPQDRIRVFHAPGPVREIEPGTGPAREVAERLREAFLASLEPDLLHVSSLFEGFGDEAVTSIGVLTAAIPTAVTLYDLIPMSVPHPHPAYRAHYERKLESFRRASLWLGISRHSCDEAQQALGLAPERIVNISCAADPRFAPVQMSGASEEALMRAHGISRPFLCCVGAAEPRKNVDLVFQAFARLEPPLRAAHQIVLAGDMLDADRDALARRAAGYGLGSSELVYTGPVTDRYLVLLYNTCRVFVFPSLYEGFGLPALEAMQCGAPVIASNASSVPEVVGLEEALFDPRSVTDLTRLLTRVLTDAAFRSRLAEHGLRQSKRFSWDRTAQLALEAIERHHGPAPARARAQVSYGDLIASVAGVLTRHRDDALMRAAAVAIARNHPPSRGPRLFVDVSGLALHAAPGGQRLARDILGEWLRTPPDGYVVEPVRASGDGEGYEYADRLAREQFGIEHARTDDDLPIDFSPGDVFLGLDAPRVAGGHRFHALLRDSGVAVYVMADDGSPTRLPQDVPPASEEQYDEWRALLAGSDGVICASRSMADQFIAWLDASGVARDRPLRVGWVDQGSTGAETLARLKQILFEDQWYAAWPSAARGTRSVALGT